MIKNNERRKIIIDRLYFLKMLDAQTRNGCVEVSTGKAGGFTGFFLAFFSFLCLSG
jgi:hypothetical protein